MLRSSQQEEAGVEKEEAEELWEHGVKRPTGGPPRSPVTSVLLCNRDVQCMLACAGGQTRENDQGEVSPWSDGLNQSNPAYKYYY